MLQQITLILDLDYSLTITKKVFPISNATVIIDLFHQKSISLKQAT